jgi:anti-sigma B factor antagonist
VPGIRHPLMINGVPVVTAPAEIDVSTAEQLRAVLLYLAACGHATVVVDMTRTRFCDSAGLTVLVRAHQRAVAEGGELRLVIAAGGAVARVFALTRLDLVIPLVRQPGRGPSPPARRRDPAIAAAAACRAPPCPAARAAGQGGVSGVAQHKLEASVTAGPSGPVITLSGERDLVSIAELSPQRPVVKVLALLGADQMFTIRGARPGTLRRAGIGGAVGRRTL